MCPYLKIASTVTHYFQYALKFNLVLFLIENTEHGILIFQMLCKPAAIMSDLWQILPFFDFCLLLLIC